MAKRIDCYELLSLDAIGNAKFRPVGLPIGYGERRRLTSRERVAKRKRNKAQRLARAAQR